MTSAKSVLEPLTDISMTLVVVAENMSCNPLSHLILTICLRETKKWPRFQNVRISPLLHKYFNISSSWFLMASLIEKHSLLKRLEWSKINFLYLSLVYGLDRLLSLWVTGDIDTKYLKSSRFFCAIANNKGFQVETSYFLMIYFCPSTN